MLLYDDDDGVSHIRVTCLQSSASGLACTILCIFCGDWRSTILGRLEVYGSFRFTGPELRSEPHQHRIGLQHCHNNTSQLSKHYCGLFVCFPLSCARRFYLSQISPVAIGSCLSVVRSESTQNESPSTLQTTDIATVPLSTKSSSVALRQHTPSSGPSPRSRESLRRPASADAIPLHQCALSYPAARPARHLGACVVALQEDSKGACMCCVLNLLAIYWVKVEFVDDVK